LDSVPDLAAEARYLHGIFFRRELPPDVVARYVEANLLICPGSHALMRSVMAAHLDAEAVELALRFRAGPTILTKKIRILFYLLEPRADYYPYFFAEGESLPRAVLGLAGSVLRTGVKAVKGVYLIRRHGIR
jgi:hypothetical protein